ncbi:MAG: hypothetical protein ACRDTG_19060 [Pseudonocardiaceae bacterium]
MTWRVARSLDVLLRQLNARFPNRSTASDGSIGDSAHSARASDHNPDAGGVVRARDFTHDPAHGVDIDRFSDEIAASRDPRIKYCIANQLIMHGAVGPRPWQWTAYTGPNPHRTHMHLSVVADKRADDPTPWALPMLARPREERVMPSPTEIWAHRVPNLHDDPQPVSVILSWTERRVDAVQQQLAAIAAELAGFAGLRAMVAQLLAERSDVTGPDKEI